jgi:hypothetical protein
MKVYIVEAFSSDPYSNTSWVDSVFSSLKSAQDHINKTRNQWGRPVELFTGDGMGYCLSDYITTREVKE